MTSTQKTTLPKVIFIKAILRNIGTLHHHGLQEKDRKERVSKTDILLDLSSENEISGYE